MLLSMENNFVSFINWLDGVMTEKNVTPTDIANTGFVSISAVSLLLSKTTKSASIEMCKAISKATGIPLITVYRRAGHLPAAPSEDETMSEISHIYDELNNTNRDDLLDYARLRLQKQEKAGKRARIP